MNNFAYVLEKPDAPPGSTMHDWWKNECTSSIDGLPALEAILEQAGTPFRHNWTFTLPKKTGMKDVLDNARAQKGTSGSETQPKRSEITQQLLQLKNPMTILEDRMLNGMIIGICLSALIYYTTPVLDIPRQFKNFVAPMFA
jgi:hypothetical protein